MSPGRSCAASVARLRIGEHVRLTLDFRGAGPIAVEAAVMAPGAP